MVSNEQKKDNLLTQWQLCVQMANSVSERRDTMNNIFVTLNLAIMAAVSIIWDIKSILMIFAGIVVCILWFLFIENYKQLNAVKFEIIDKIEKEMSFQPFSEEWKLLKYKKKYRQGTELEKYLPILFIILYIIAASCILVIKFKGTP